MKYIDIKKIARRLRNNPTPSEKLLWSYLKNKQLKGRKFLRQHPIIYENIGNELFCFIPDFYCKKENLVVEVDGGIHYYQKQRDQKRDLILKAIGLKVLRIDNNELLCIESVLEKICNEFKENNQE